MSIHNQISIIGNVGSPPEHKGKTQAGKSIAGFALAQSATTLNPETQERTWKEPQWFQISCFAGLAEKVCGNLKKGDLILVSGELKARSYTSKTGEKRLSFEITAQDVLRVERLKQQAPVNAEEVSS